MVTMMVTTTMTATTMTCACKLEDRSHPNKNTCASVDQESKDESAARNLQDSTMNWVPDRLIHVEIVLILSPSQITIDVVDIIDERRLTLPE